MRKEIMLGLALGLIAAATPAQAQLFNSSKKNNDSSGNVTAAPSNRVFNNSGEAAPVFIAPSNPNRTGMRQRSVAPSNSTNQGFNRPAGAGSTSTEDRAIREAAMRRAASAEQAFLNTIADAERRRAEAESGQTEMVLPYREDRDFGANVPDSAPADDRRQVYDRHRNAGAPAAPPKLFNSRQ